MKEIFEKKIETETITNDKLDLSLFKRKSSAKTYRGWILGEFKKAVNEKNQDVAAILQTCYKKYMDFNQFESKALIEIEIVEGWKGTDSLDFFKGFTEDFIINSRQKDKETGEISTQSHQIPFKRVNLILWVIKHLKVEETIDYRKIVKKIIKSYDLQVGLDAFNGGRNRAKYYFPLYYYPIKILESLNFIKYSGRGKITRIK